jgi:hypothetical protein
MQYQQINTLARQAGFLYCLLIPLGIFSLLYLPANLIVPNDPSTTLANITSNIGLYRAGIAGAFAIQLVQLFTAIALYRLFKPVNKGVASLIILFTVAAVPMAMINELSHITVLHFIENTGFASMFSPEQITQWTAFLLDLNADGIMIVSFFWGLWLLPMGYLVLQSGFFPKLLGWALIVAFACYVIDAFIWILVPQYTLHLTDVLGWGEAIFPIWLLVRGVTPKRFEQWNEVNA